VLLSAFGFALLPILAVFAYHEGANVATLLFLRFTFAAFLLFAYLRLKGEKLALTRRQGGLLLLLGGILYSAQAFLFFASVELIPASLTSLLLYTYPIFVALLAGVVDKERLNTAEFLAIALSLTGLVFVLGSAPAAVNLTGVLLALGAAVVYSVYLVVGTRVVKGLSPLATSACVAAWASLSLLITGGISGSLNFNLTATAALAVAGIVAFPTIMAMLTLFRGLDLIGPTRASILSMIEPLITFVLAAILFGDRFTPPQLAGGVAVLTGAALVIRARGQGKTDEKK
jgi:drug/metabolite transporter (DMT)-like permease